MSSLALFVVAPPGLEPCVADELAALGLGGGRIVPGGVEVDGAPEAVVRANLELRVASRVLVRLARFPVTKLSELERRAADAVDWPAWLPSAAAPVQATCRGSRIYHSGAAAERVRRALDRRLGAAGPAPPQAPAVKVHLERDVCTLSLDTSGAHLHERGYRLETAKAPLRETLAAGLLALAGWRPAAGEALFDPMCGSGTLPIEALLAATGRAPGLGRSFAGESCPALPLKLWRAARAAAEARVVPPAVRVAAADRDAGAVEITARNAARAGVNEHLSVTRAPIAAARPPAAAGLLLCNPPYGLRVGRGADLRNLYAALGNVFRRHFAGWRLAVCTADARLAGHTGVHFAWVSPPLPHGGLKVRLYVSELPDGRVAP